MAKFKVGDILVANDPEAVIICRLEILKSKVNHYYVRVIKLVSSTASCYEENECAILDSRHTERNYKLDPKYLDRIELEKDIKETFNG